MIKFKKLTKEDFHLIDKYFCEYLSEKRDTRFCDYAPGTVKMWHEAYEMEYAESRGLLYLRAKYEEEAGTSYLMPVGKDPYFGLAELYKYIEQQNEATLSCVPSEYIEPLCSVFGIKRDDFYADRDWADYIYLKEQFCNPSGRKQHNYKNNLNRFKREYPDYEIEPLCGDNKGEAVEFFIKYCHENPESSSVDSHEYSATLPVIEDPSLYSMTGAILRVNGRIIGLTLGEVYGDTVIVHTEKADKSVIGAYQTLAFGFQLMMPKSVVYINREEDMGLEGLRRSKTAYCPERLDYKYTMKVK